MRLGGFWDDLLQSGTQIATTALNRPPAPTYGTYQTPPMFPATTSYPPAYDTTPGDWMQPSMNTLLMLGAVGLGVYLLMKPRGRR